MNEYNFLVASSCAKAVPTKELLCQLAMAGHSPNSAQQWLNKYTVSGCGLSMLKPEVIANYYSGKCRNGRIVKSRDSYDPVNGYCTQFNYKFQYFGYSQILSDDKWETVQEWRDVEWPLKINGSVPFEGMQYQYE